MKTIDRIPTSKIQRASKLVSTGAKVGVNYLKYYGDKLTKTEVEAKDRLNQNNADDQIPADTQANWYADYTIGARYGLNTETANINPTFRIDKKAGVINFDSTMLNESCILEYISDGMEGGDDSQVSVNKLFEDYVYAYIEYAILNSKFNVQEYIINRARKRKTALLRNAKIRLSNIHPGRLLMNLRGESKWIK